MTEEERPERFIFYPGCSTVNNTADKLVGDNMVIDDSPGLRLITAVSNVQPVDKQVQSEQPTRGFQDNHVAKFIINVANNSSSDDDEDEERSSVGASESANKAAIESYFMAEPKQSITLLKDIVSIEDALEEFVRRKLVATDEERGVSSYYTESKSFDCSKSAALKTRDYEYNNRLNSSANSSSAVGVLADVTGIRRYRHKNHHHKEKSMRKSKHKPNLHENSQASALVVSVIKSVTCGSSSQLSVEESPLKSNGTASDVIRTLTDCSEPDATLCCKKTYGELTDNSDKSGDKKRKKKKGKKKKQKKEKKTNYRLSRSR